MSNEEQQNIARRACINFAEYRMFQAKAQRSRSRYVEQMAQIGIQITPENEGKNELIREEPSEGEESGVSWNPEEDEEKRNRSSEALQATAKAVPSGKGDRNVPRSDGLVYLEDARRSMEENPEGRYPESPWRGTQRQEKGKTKGKGKSKGKKGKRKRGRRGGEGVDDPIFEPRGPHQPPGSGHHGGPGSGGAGMAGASMISVRAYRVVRDQGQEWDLVDQEERSDNGTENATIGSILGSRTEGELPEFPVAGYPERYLRRDGGPYPSLPEIPLLLDGRPAVGRLERIEPERPDTPTGVAGFRAREGFHVVTYRVPTSEGPPSSSEGRRPSASQQSPSPGRSELRGTMSLTLTLPGEEATTLEGSLTLEAPERGGSKKGENKIVEKEESQAAFQEVNEEKSRLKQRILTAAKIAPKAASSSSSSSKEISRAEKEEIERQEMRVAFEEGGEAVGRRRPTSSMNMTAMDFRAIVASDEARAFRQEAARQRIRDQETSSMVNREIQRSEGHFGGEEPSGGSSERPLPSSSPGLEGAENDENGEMLEALRNLNPKSKPKAKSIQNPWNRFQHENAGRGWSMAKMQEEYYKWRDGKP